MYNIYQIWNTYTISWNIFIQYTPQIGRGHSDLKSWIRPWTSTDNLGWWYKSSTSCVLCVWFILEMPCYFVRFGGPFRLKSSGPKRWFNTCIYYNQRDSEENFTQHYGDVKMGVLGSQITSLMIVYSTVHSGTDQRKHQSSASLAFVRGIHRWPVNSLHKWPVMQKMFPFDDVIMVSTVFTDSLTSRHRSICSWKFDPPHIITFIPMTKLPWKWHDTNTSSKS